MHLRGALRVLLWFIVVVALALAAGELGVRWLAPQTPLGMLVADAAMGFRLAPNYRGQQRTKDGSVALAFNSWGLRDREYGARVPGSLRIYVLGDSFVFGYGVPLDDSFTKVLERTLQQRLGSRAVEVVNGGVPRFCTIQEATLLQRTIDLVKPDLVLLGFFMGNDVLDNLEFARARKPRPADTRATGVLGWVRVHSQLYMWARHRHNRAQGRESARQREVMEQYAASPSGDMAAGMAATEESILGLAKTVERHGARFAVLLFPPNVQVYPALWQQTLTRYGLVASQYERRLPNLRLAAFAKDHGIALLDLLPPLEGRQDEPLYSGIHWNARCQALAAAATADFLVDSDLIGRSH